MAGKYAIRDLVQKLPNGNPQHDTGTSDDTIAAVLATMNEVVKKNSVFARTMVDAGGVDRLMYMQKNVPRFSSRVVKFNQQVTARSLPSSPVKHCPRLLTIMTNSFLSIPLPCSYCRICGSTRICTRRTGRTAGRRRTSWHAGRWSCGARRLTTTR